MPQGVLTLRLYLDPRERVRKIRRVRTPCGKRHHPHLLPCLLAAALLFGALGSHQYGYYQILRWATAGAAGYCAWTFWTHRIKAIPWVFIGKAILFNPLAPIYLDRQTWRLIDIAAGVIFLVAGAVRKTAD